LSRSAENTGFRCLHCGADVWPVTNGGYRNHCPFCLHSRHVDERPGDRASSCRGLMAPIALDRSTKKGFQIVHVCVTCGVVRRNRAAVDTQQPDDLIAFMRSQVATGRKQDCRSTQGGA
jgi:DNA-directed RNA polymerase subunit RPC12/RpoP